MRQASDTIPQLTDSDSPGPHFLNYSNCRKQLYFYSPMIYYYSATGNTKYAAGYLSQLLDDTVVDILQPQDLSSCHESDDPIGIMFPIYCWGIPPVVSHFLGNHLFPKISKERYVWGVCTCGDEAGTAMRQLNDSLVKHTGRDADALWSLIMPNTYVMLPGFDVDSEEVEAAKLKNAPLRLDDIARKIKKRTKGLYDVQQGSMPRLRSAIFPVFKKWGVNTNWWHVAETCIGCGKCASVCPAGNIKMENSRPDWGKNCFSCCACYHCCPTQAISYSSFTKNKSQYGGIPGFFAGH